MLNRVTPQKYFCGIDLGSHKIRAGLIEAQSANQVELLGVFEHKVQGFRDASISNLSEFTESIHYTLKELSKRTGIKIKHVQLGIGGGLVSIRESHTVIPLVDRGNKVISKRDIQKVDHQARLLGLKMEEEVLHDLPISYQIDDTGVALNPIGLYAHKLGVHSAMILAKTNLVRNVGKAIEQAGYDVANVYFNSYVAADMALTDEEKREGCAVVDIGSQHTSVIVFKNGALSFLRMINFGGEHLTRNISKQLNLNLDLAEEIKKSYAMATGPQAYSDEEILVKKESQYLPVKRELIHQAISPEIEKFIQEIQSVLKASSVNLELNRGIVMIGGGSMLPGLIEQVSEHLGVPVHLGKLTMKTRKSLSNSAQFLAVAGLAVHGMQASLQHALQTHTQGPWHKTLTIRAKEFYQEYF